MYTTDLRCLLTGDETAYAKRGSVSIYLSCCYVAMLAVVARDRPVPFIGAIRASVSSD